jgi:hypothetical protein
LVFLRAGGEKRSVRDITDGHYIEGTESEVDTQHLRILLDDALWSCHPIPLELPHTFENILKIQYPVFRWPFLNSALTTWRGERRREWYR